MLSDTADALRVQRFGPKDTLSRQEQAMLVAGNHVLGALVAEEVAGARSFAFGLTKLRQQVASPNKIGVIHAASMYFQLADRQVAATEGGPRAQEDPAVLRLQKLGNLGVAIDAASIIAINLLVEQQRAPSSHALRVVGQEYTPIVHRAVEHCLTPLMQR
jgi:hypothetical protein